MQLLGGSLVYSATDLVGFLECRHLANLERAAVEGHVQRPVRDDPVLDRIAQRGLEHEERFLDQLTAEGASIDEIETAGESSFERITARRDATLESMRRGVDVIYQAVLFDERRLGYADFLRRVERPSQLGAWSYEVWDTKLARHAKASAVLQLSMYSDMLAAMQGLEPASMHLALGGVARETALFRVAEYAAYYRSVARDFEEQLEAASSWPVATLSAPVEHCDICRWTLRCRGEWRERDDLALVAGLNSRQRRALTVEGIATRTALAEPADEIPDRLDDVSRDALARLRAQAAIQVRGEHAGQVFSERIDPPRDREGALRPDHGLLMLPPASEGDLFFDIEGDPFFGSDEIDGIDYLFGVIEPAKTGADGEPAFHAFWATDGGTVTPASERQAFEALVDLLMDRLEDDPNLHVYHYAPYEPTAVKRLAGRYGTREVEVDQLLRGRVFVDLYRAVGQGIRASVESYSIKRLEPLYGFERAVDLRDAGTSIVEFETWLEIGAGEQSDELLAEIEGYNRDDCVSTLLLRDWLEIQRTALEGDLGEPLPRPEPIEEDQRQDSEAQQAVRVLAENLAAGASDDLDKATEADRGRWLLAQLLEWHRREERSFWWRYFFLKDELSDEERLDEPDALAGLTFEESWGDPAPKARSTIYRFRFPRQEHRIALGNQPHDPATGRAAGTVYHLDDDAGIIDLRLASNRPPPTATSLIPFELATSCPASVSTPNRPFFPPASDVYFGSSRGRPLAIQGIVIPRSTQNPAIRW